MKKNKDNQIDDQNEEEILGTSKEEVNKMVEESKVDLKEETNEVIDKTQVNSNEKNNEKVEDSKEETNKDEKDSVETGSSEEIKELINGENDKSERKNHTLVKKILSNILDQLIVLAASGIVLLLFDFLIRLIGYMVAMPVPVLLCIYFIINCLYVPIMEKTKSKKTFGKKILNVE